MKLAQQLAQARADLVSLEGDTATLEANVARQTDDLDHLRREARAGRAEFAQVVAQQTRRDAAAGMLGQHLEDLAQARALVEELEAAQDAATTGQQLSETRVLLVRLEAEFHAEARQVEDYLTRKRDRLREMQQAHAEAQAGLWPIFRDGAAARSGASVQAVTDLLRHARAAPSGPVREAILEALAAVADQYAAHDLRPLAEQAAEGLPYRATPAPRDLPQVARLLETDGPGSGAATMIYPVSAAIDRGGYGEP